MLPDFLWESLEGADGLLLVVVLLGNGLGPGVLFGLAAIGARAVRRLAERLRWPSLAVAAVAGLLALPWAVDLAVFTMSGPLAQTLPARGALTWVLSTCLALVFAGAGWWLGGRWSVGRSTAWLALPLLGVAVAVAAASHHLYPDEYLPLHTFLGVVTVMLLGLAALEAVGARGRGGRMGASLVLAAWFAAAVAVPLLGDVAWIVWGEATFARHTTGPLLPEALLGEASGTPEPEPDPPLTPEAAEIQRRAELREAEPPHIVLLFIDNVQRERVGLYGYRKNPTTPNIDALFGDGVIFDRAVSPIPATRSFMTMLLTGRYAPDISAHKPPKRYKTESVTQHLRQRGYLSYVQGVFELSNFAQLREKDYAIDRFFPPLAVRQEEVRKRRKGLVRTLDEQLDAIREHLQSARRSSSPVLIWVHVMGPHLSGRSFVSSPEFPFGESMDDQYDSAIAAADAELPRLQQLIEEEGGGRGVVWVFGSDHGPGLGRYKKPATKTLFADHIDVPLIVRAPGFEPRRVDRAVNAPIDVAATLLDLAGLPVPAGYHGTSLLADMLGHPRADVPIVLHLSAPGSRWAGCIKGKYKAIERQGKAKYLFDLTNDPEERRNLAWKQREKLASLLGVYDAKMPKWFGAFHALTGKTFTARK